MNNIEKTKAGLYTYKEKDYNFNFYTDIDLITKAKFVANVTDLVVSDKNYQSVLRDVIFDFQLISMLTDVDLSEINESGYMLGKIVDLVTNSNIVDIVKANAVEGLIDELNESVDNNIEYKTGIHRNPLNEGLTSLLKTIESKISQINLDELVGLAQSISGVSGEITADKIIEAYGNSNVFKKTREDADKRLENNVAKAKAIIEAYEDKKDIESQE